MVSKFRPDPGVHVIASELYMNVTSPSSPNPRLVTIQFVPFQATVVGWSARRDVRVEIFDQDNPSEL
jgi:hypothetical protein